MSLYHGFRHLSARAGLGLSFVVLVGLSPVFATAQGSLNFYVSPFENALQEKIQFLKSTGYVEYQKAQSSAEFRPIELLIVDPTIDNREVREFLAALRDEKPTLMEMYGVDNRLYNEFALKAVGILGQESQFFKHFLYQYKANLPDPIVYATKRIVNFFKQEATDDLSKGPTAMKAIPSQIAEHYGLTDKEELEVPFNAAVATIGYLAETYTELLEKKRAYELDCITEDNIADMHLYLYFGGASYRRDLLNCEVTPHRNIYIRNVNNYSYKVQLFEYRP